MALSKHVNRALVFALLILYTFSQLYLVSQTLECSLSPVFLFKSFPNNQLIGFGTEFPVNAVARVTGVIFP